MTTRYGGQDDRPLKPQVQRWAAQAREGKLDRREFLALASIFGASTATAYGLLGLAAPTPARAQSIAQGGTLRIQQFVKPISDPRTYDWSEHGNLTRGFLEYLVEYNRDGTFRGMLLESWEINEDATQYTLNIRDGINWNNGEKFTAADVARNIEGWCDSTLEANSMASRMGQLVDPSSGMIRKDAIEIVDETTVALYLPSPDITLLAGMSDYPAAIVHGSYDGGSPFENGIGTGPYRPVEMEVGKRAVLERNTDMAWWGTEIFGGPYVDRVEFIDYGTDAAAWVKAAEAGEVDLLYETLTGDVSQMDAIGWTKSETVTAATIVIRPNQAVQRDGVALYGDARVRRALALAVDNEKVLASGYDGFGTAAENHHVCPIHPEYADIGPPKTDPQLALSLMEEAGKATFEHELIAVDENWQIDTCTAIAEQIGAAGIPIRLKILPGEAFWDEWTRFPFSATSWNHRPLGVQVLALAYRTGESWNESAFSNAEFDAALADAMAVADADLRRDVMAKLEQILRDEGVIIQPYWRSLFNHFDSRLVNAEKHPQHEIQLYKIGFAS